MGSPTSDDDPTRRVPGPGGWGQGGPGPGDAGGSGQPPPPPPGQGGGYLAPDDPTTRLPPAEQWRGRTAQFPAAGGWPQGPGGPYPHGGPYPQAGPGGYPQDPGGQHPPQGPDGPHPPQGPGGPHPTQGPGGPYPPQGPPGAYAYGGPPPGGGRSNRGLAIALAVGLLVLAGIAIALVFAFTRDEGETVGAEPSTSSGPAPTSASSPDPTGSPSSAPSSSSGTAGDRTGELLATVPADLPDCAATDLVGDGDVAAVDCGPSTTQPGPQTASFHLYEDTATLEQVFASDAEGLTPMPAGEDCATAQGVTTWNVDGMEGGDIACTITEDGLLVFWTDREFGIEGVVAAPGATQEELSALAEWWRSNSDYQR